MKQLVAVAGRREIVHKVVYGTPPTADSFRIGTQRCHIDYTDEEWAPRIILASKVAGDADRCRWCFPAHRST